MGLVDPNGRRPQLLENGENFSRSEVQNESLEKTRFRPGVLVDE
jgi:hypothetical protein